jgi:uncharacterized membrane protein YhaH (DUF805 family)
MGNRGTIAQLANAGSLGRVDSEYGDTYVFDTRHVRSGETLSLGAEVDFILLRGEVRDLFVVPPPGQRGVDAPAAPPPKVYYRKIPGDPVLTYYRRAMTKRWADFRGRARRKEYYSVLLGALIALVLANVIDETLARTLNLGQRLFGWLPQDADADGVAEPVVLYLMTVIVATVHGIAVVSATIRRLHDAGKNWGDLWILLIPYVGVFFMLAQSLQDSQQAENKYGPSPKYRS